MLHAYHPYARPYDGITTVRGALDHLNEGFADQVEEAIVQQAPPNTAIPGDDAVRNAFWALLPPDEQRAFFCAWPATAACGHGSRRS